MRQLTFLIAVLILSVSCSQSDQEAAKVSSGEAEIPVQLVALSSQLEGEASVREIKRLQYAFAQYVSAGSWSDAEQLFSSDGHGISQVIDSAEINTSDESGMEAFLQTSFGLAKPELGEGDLNQHLLISPVISLSESGESAKGRWRLVALKGIYQESAEWLGGIFENSYIKEKGLWKISELRFYPIYGGDFSSGWRNLKEETPENVKAIPFHYTADSAGIPNPLANHAVDLIEVDGSESNAKYVADLHRKAQHLLDEDAVNNLQSAYGYYFDRQLWDDLADLFHQDGSFELDHRGVYIGKQNIRYALDQFGSQGLPPTKVNDHLQLQPVVTVAPDGLTATARGTELRQVGVHEQESKWGLSIYQNEFEKVDDTWQIKSVHASTRLLSDANQGWAVNAQSVPVSDENFPADATNTTQYSAYPSFSIPEIKYRNPALVCGSCELTASSVATSFSEAAQEVQRRVRVLNAYSGSENISNAYGYYIDEFMWDGMADVFSEGGWKELSYIGSYVGRERVRYSVVSRYGRGGRRPNGNTFHQKTQPFVTVAEDGNSARIRTRLFQLNSSRENPGSYISGIYENQIVNENGIWKVSGMDLDYAWLANYEGGWQTVVPGSSNRYAPAPGSLTGDQAPDRPLRGVTFAPYPQGQVDMAFHFLNPVSGRKPPIYLPEVDYEAMSFGE